MTGLLLQIGATKLAVSAVLAAAVWIAHRRVARPAVSHPLWLLVLVTLLTPAIISIPVLPAELVAPLTTGDAGAPQLVLAEGPSYQSTGPPPGAVAPPVLAILWLLGTAGFLGWTLARTIRFKRTLARASRQAPVSLQRQAAAIGRDLGLTRIPEVHSTNARVMPLVWWTGGKVRVLIPAFLLTDLSREELRAILTHELSHVRRRDHIVRWLEWLACSAFWWNPVTWWARHQLRVAEEACCDRLALDTASFCPRTYANALLQVVTSTSAPLGFRPPLPASAAGGGGRTRGLERRLRMIVSTDTRSPAPRWLRAATWVAVLCALPFGLIYCDRPEAPTEPDEDAAADLAVLDAPRQPAEPAESDLDAVLSNREEEINRDILQDVGSGALSLVHGLELSAYVAGAKAGLLVSYGDLDLSEEEKQRLADTLSASVDRRRPPGGIAMRDPSLHRELIHSVLSNHSELLQRATHRLVRLPPIVRRPAPPIIKGPLRGSPLKSAQ
ncbi:MAG: M56 family metallopeptidase [Gemmatimonadota bacterium]|nr:M56 family metallopeptidase [Gemmatimonadota bacterium]